MTLDSPTARAPIGIGQRVDPVRKITPPEDKETPLSPKIATAIENKPSYDQAYAFVKECIALRRGDSDSYGPLEDCDRPFAFKISGKDWVKLASELTCGKAMTLLHVSVTMRLRPR